MKKKIGGVIVSDLEHTNYGSSLQAYATMKVVQTLGYDFTFIKYQKQRNIFDWIKIAPGLILSGGLELINNRLKFKLNCFMHPSYLANQTIRRKEARKFKEKEFVPFFKTYIGYKNLCEGSKEYDAVFVGSDQTWRPFGFYSNYWNLTFVDDSIPKFSYAASYGVSKIPSIQKKGTKKYLERLNMISVREQKGKEIVESISNKKAQVVADPSMLLNKEEWTEFANHSTFMLPKEKYIFCYFLGTRTDIRNEANKLAQNTGLKIVTMRHMDEYVPVDNTFGDFAPYNINPYDFVKLLMNAEYVCTDSFHGSVFSILMHKKFCTFYRVKPTKKNSTHSRIDNLFSIFGLQDRKFSGNILDIKNEIDYNIIDKKLITYRKESLDFFRKSLELSNKE
ncbi:polysaccharide pyruvyl transferase family protein [Bacteroides sp. ET225]|uniref:polysaccharide pyruvyl transferase family protein n=1 Tax=Bacteroides sp. ET225 TaxID=2972461 RepID=UPI0021AC32F1|nr:polysaccharide pyruvyl transferase family protein [Bacteroides sp. ET225]MCR8918311.1 polysaccharide pyruvyl transferase family protein [Bacteroides sp. ET225]